MNERISKARRLFERRTLKEFRKAGAGAAELVELREVLKRGRKAGLHYHDAVQVAAAERAGIAAARDALRGNAAGVGKLLCLYLEGGRP